MFLVSHGSWQNRWKISLTPERKIRWTVKTTAGVKDVDSRTVVASGTYYHVTGVYNGTDLEIHVNGEFENFVPWAGRTADSGDRSDGRTDAACGRELQLRRRHR